MDRPAYESNFTYYYVTLLGKGEPHIYICGSSCGYFEYSKALSDIKEVYEDAIILNWKEISEEECFDIKRAIEAYKSSNH